MAKHPKKPLSPYDPRYKMSKEFDSNGGKKEPERREDRFSPRGCGDPSCTMCNSHIPSDVARNRNFGRGITATEINARRNENMNEREDMYRMMREAVNAARSDEGMRTFIMGEFPSAPRPSTPALPASLTEARKAVEKYILAKDHTTTWDSVIGNDTAKTALRDAIESQTNDRDLYEHYGMTTPKGVLLWGPPGCGKTMFAKASATAMKAIHGKDVEILAINGNEIQSPYVSVTEGIITSLFLYAREYRTHHGHPLIMFIDECDTLLPDRTGRVRRVAPWEESQVSVFLGELDGMKDLGAFVILATNQPDKLDEALLRDGRIDRKIKIERPTRKAIEHIIYNGLIGVPLMESVETLAFVAAEALSDPAYVLKEGHILMMSLNDEGGKQLDRDIAHNFCLEHIVSGAMASSIPTRAKGFAFRRDRQDNTRTGIQQRDIISAVREVFEENKDLEHSFALKEFIDAVPVKELMEPKGKLQ